MADYTLASGDHGLYEIPVNTTEVTVDVIGVATPASDRGVAIVNHQGSTGNVYASWGTVTAKAGTAWQVVPSTWKTIPAPGSGGTLHLIATAAAIVSIEKDL